MSDNTDLPIATWQCIDKTCSGERHPYGSWEDAQRAMERHAREVEHDNRWPLTMLLHGGNRKFPTVTYVKPVRGV